MNGFVVEKIGQLFILEGVKKKGGRHVGMGDLSAVRDGALVVRGTAIAWAGPSQDLPSRYKKLRKINAHGAIVAPGFVDSHTHLVFAGDRSREFEMRSGGASYQDIASAGGGIINTVRATRDMAPGNLFKLAQKRVENCLRQGVTTVEIKTGYGLSFDAEKKSLEVIQKLKRSSKCTIKATFLGAHAVPAEFRGKKTEYVSLVARNWLPKLRSKCDFVDMFLDEGYFDATDAAILFHEAQKLNLPIKLHADELQLSGGTDAAVRFNALSADHLLKITDAEVRKLAASEVTATLLPTTAFFLKAPYAPARELLDAGARVALATDFNPGTSPSQDISFVGTLAALEMGMRCEEIVAGLTYNGACALGLQNKKGALLPGYDADFVIFEGESLARLFYEFGYGKPAVRTFARGLKA